MKAWAWYSDYPTNTSLEFAGTGSFHGGDFFDSTGEMPLGLIYEVHDAPAGLRTVGLQPPKYSQPVARITNNAFVLDGYSSSLPVEDFEIVRSRGVIRITEPTTTSIDVEVFFGAFLELWGLYYDVPLLTPTQPGWTASSPTAPTFAATIDGTAFPGITGQGAVAMDATAIGARVDITTLPGRAGEEDGFPPRRWGLGWCNWIVGIGYDQPMWLSSTGSVFPTPLGRVADGLAYSIPLDVVVTITCLLPN